MAKHSRYEEEESSALPTTIDTEGAAARGSGSRATASVRSLAITGLFVLGLFYTLYSARAVFLPVVVAVLLSFLLDPVVRALSKVRIPRGLSAALVLAVLIGGAGYGISQLADPAVSWIAK